MTDNDTLDGELDTLVDKFDEHCDGKTITCEQCELFKPGNNAGEFYCPALQDEVSYDTEKCEYFEEES